MDNNLNKAINRLDNWIMINGWEGWDPYDIKQITIDWKRTMANRIYKRGLLSYERFFPEHARRLFKVSKTINPKAMGLFLSSYMSLYKVTKNDEYYSKALEIADWLLENSGSEYKGRNWGYPFDWQSIKFIPKGTPSSVVTKIIGDGFLTMFLYTQDEKFLRVCIDICEFFVNELNVTYKKDDVICFSYTPLDDYQVHNANLFVSDFLVKIGKIINSPEYLNLGISSGKFALIEQNEEGYLPYWGRAQTVTHSGGKIHVDHYHSGFEIRMLHSLWKQSGIDEFKSAYLKYFDWYKLNMFDHAGEVMFSPQNKYPINIHSCAEAILCFSCLLSDHPEEMSKIDNIVDWVLNTMENTPGQYTYLIDYYKFIGEYKSNIPMIRWGQAWMFRALTELAQAKNN